MKRHSLVAWLGALGFVACGGVSTIGGGPGTGGTGGSGGTGGGSDDAGACVCTGPRPLSPNFQCPDGSIGGPVCETSSNNTCSWKIRLCPDAGASSDAGPCVCTGTRPAIANFQCPDGSIGGPVCETNSDQTCSWKIRSCPKDAGTCTCTGPRPLSPNFECPDGSIGGPVCSANSDDTCSWKIRSCPDAGPNACQPSQCSDSTQCAVGSACVEVPTGGGCIFKHCCPAFGCNPQCPNGVAKDANGCDTCQCAPAQ